MPPILTIVEIMSLSYFFFFLLRPVFMWRNFLPACPLISQPWCGARVIREYYLALTLPLFHRTSTLLLSLSVSNIFRDNASLFLLEMLRLLKGVTAEKGERLLQSERERERESVAPTAFRSSIAAYQLAGPCVREK